MRETPSSAPHEFDYDDWVESVKGETVHVTSPEEGTLGPKASALVTPKTPDSDDDARCHRCDDYVRPVLYEGRVCCPLCGSELGALEMGSKRVDPWDRDD